MRHEYHIETHRLQLWHEEGMRKKRIIIAAFTIIGMTIFGALSAAFNILTP